MNTVQEKILQKTTIGFLGEYLKSQKDNEFVDIEHNAEVINQNMEKEIRALISEKMSEQEVQWVFGMIENYISTRETLYFVYGIRTGAKLLNELIGNKK